MLSDSELQEISTNTLVIVGENDHFVAPDVAVDLHASLPNSHLWIVPHSRHIAFNGDHESEFLRIADSFLSGAWEE